MGSDSRARLAETRGPRDESPSSNLGRGKQGQAIRVDCTNPQDDSGTGVATRRGIQASLIKATEEKSVSSEAETVQKRWAVQEVAEEAQGAGELRIEETDRQVDQRQEFHEAL